MGEPVFDLREREDLTTDEAADILRAARREVVRIYVRGGSQPDRKLMLLLGGNPSRYYLRGNPDWDRPGEWLMELDLRPGKDRLR